MKPAFIQVFSQTSDVSPKAAFPPVGQLGQVTLQRRSDHPEPISDVHFIEVFVYYRLTHVLVFLTVENKLLTDFILSFGSRSFQEFQ